MTNTKTMQIIFAILSLIMLITIFSFSNQNGETSEGLSQKISRKIVEIANGKNEITELNMEEQIYKVDAVIRKLAHFTIYTVLGICLMVFFNTLTIDNKKRIALVIIIGAIYATTDEIHQLFISERTARITDVMIDTAGVVFGVLIANKMLLFAKSLLKKITKKI